MKHASSRGGRFHILDGMLLIAACALGMSMGSWSVAANEFRGTRWGEIQEQATWWATFLALAILLIEIRSGFNIRKRRRLTTRPGFTACLACWVGVATIVLMEMTMRLILLGRSGSFAPITGRDLQQIYRVQTVITPALVAASWLLQAIGGRWKPERRIPSSGVVGRRATSRQAPC